MPYATLWFTLWTALPTFGMITAFVYLAIIIRRAREARASYMNEPREREVLLLYRDRAKPPLKVPRLHEIWLEEKAIKGMECEEEPSNRTISSYVLVCSISH